MTPPQKGSTKKADRNKRRRQRRRTKKKVTVNNAPIAKTVLRATREPRFTQSKNCVTVRHREYIADITSANASYIVRNWAVNPGISQTFPWLSVIASRYESYLLDNLNFIYEPICPTTTPGSIMMAVDFDAGDTPPGSKVQIMSYASAVRIAPWDRRVFNAKISDLHKFGIQRYVRAGVPPGASDIKTYDVGNFFIASQNTPATDTVLGELYVEYTVKFFTPQIQTGTGVQKGNNSYQYGRITIPAVGIPTYVATIVSAAPQPIAWVDQRVTTTSPINMFIDTSTNTDLLVKVFGSNATADRDYISFFNNQNPDGLSSGMSMYTVDPSVGFRNTLQASIQDIAYLLKPSINAQNNPTGAGGVFPIQWKRPSSGQTVYDISFIPTSASALPVINTNRPQAILGAWNFPQINIPNFRLALVNKDGRNQRLNCIDDGVNVICKEDSVEV